MATAILDLAGSKLATTIAELVIKSTGLGDSGGTGEFQTMTGRKGAGGRSRGAVAPGVSESDKNDDGDEEEFFHRKILTYRGNAEALSYPQDVERSGKTGLLKLKYIIRDTMGSSNSRH